MQLAIPVEDNNSWRSYPSDAMNRIREVREAAGLTQEELAERVGTHANTISRLEIGKIQLTQVWMMALAEALSCHPADFITNVVAAEAVADVETAPDNPVASAIASRGFRVYRVTARTVIEAGIGPGDIITVDESEQAVANVKGLDIVLVEMGPNRTRALRQYIPPGKLMTNRPGADLAISLNDPTVNPVIVGVVLREAPDGAAPSAPERLQTRPPRRTSDRS
jgi:transcriptional regulator with XRE-family HTH domain